MKKHFHSRNQTAFSTNHQPGTWAKLNQLNTILLAGSRTLPNRFQHPVRPNLSSFQIGTLTKLGFNINKGSSKCLMYISLY